MSLFDGFVAMLSSVLVSEEKYFSVIKSGELDAINEMLNSLSEARKKELIDLKDEDDATALMWAACKGNSDITKALIEAGVKLDVQNRNGATALMSAAFWGRVDTAKVLIEAGADPDLKGKNGRTALMMAEEYIHLEGGGEVVDMIKKAIEVKSQKEKALERTEARQEEIFRRNKFFERIKRGKSEVKPTDIPKSMLKL